MGLSQLLAVSRSVRTIKDGPAPYKMTQQNLLPRFGTEKTAEDSAGTLADLAPPVMTPPAMAPDGASANLSAPGPAPDLMCAPVAVSPAPERIEKTEPASKESEPGLASEVSAWKAARSARPPRAAAFVEATKKLRPFGSLFRNPFRQLLARETANAPLQAELSLDLVKPIRNELREGIAERELWQVRESAAPEPGVSAPRMAPQVTPRPGPSSTGHGRTSLMGRLKNRVFGAGHPG